MRRYDAYHEQPKISVRVSPEFHRRVRVWAAARDTSIQAEVVEALRERMERIERGE